MALGCVPPADARCSACAHASTLLALIADGWMQLADQLLCFKQPTDGVPEDTTSLHSSFLLQATLPSPRTTCNMQQHSVHVRY